MHAPELGGRLVLGDADMQTVSMRIRPTLRIENLNFQLSDAILRLLQFRIFGFGGNQNRNVRVGIFPE